MTKVIVSQSDASVVQVKTAGPGQGPAGVSGSATVAIGTTTTGSAGTNASVTNTGTTTAAILNFTIPAGATGAQGAAGLSDIVSDTTLQLGGDLDMNSKFISSGILGVKNQGAQSELRLFCESSNAHYASIKAPAHSDFSGDITFTMPANYGSANQVLTTDGSGGTSWAAASGGLPNNASGTNSLGIGTNTLDSEQSGAENNTAFGDEALTAVQTGDNNVAIGHEAGIALTSGSRSVFIGKEAGKAHDTYSDNIYIGYQTGLVQDRGQSNVLIGNNCQSVF